MSFWKGGSLSGRVTPEETKNQPSETVLQGGQKIGCACRWTRTLLLSGLLATLGLTGCGANSGGGNAVAIVNLEKVLKMTGADLEMNNAMQEREKQIRSGLANFQQQIEEAYNKKKDELGETPTDEQLRELQELQNQLVMQGQQARNQANQSLNNFQQDLFEGFQQQVGPVSLEVAKEKGFAIVLGQNPSILAFDTTIDITDDVIDRMKKMKPGSLDQAEGDSPSGLPLRPPASTPGAPSQPAQPSGPVSITPPLKTPAAPELPPQEPAPTDSPTPTPEPEKKPELEPTSEPEAEKKPETKPEPETKSEPEAKSDPEPSTNDN